MDFVAAMKASAGLYKLQGSQAPERILGRVRFLEQGNLRLRRGGLGPITGPYSKIGNDTFDSVGNIDTTRSAVRKLGSVPPSNNTTGFAFSATGNSITWFWDGTNTSNLIILRRADSTIQVIPAGSLTVSGLAPLTDYYFFPFWTPNNRCTIGWVQGSVGDPMVAFTLADLNDVDIGPAAVNQQTLQDREPLTAGGMTATTLAGGSPPSGGGPGGGGGGPGSGCVMAGTCIEPLGDISYSVEVLPENYWMHLEADGRTLNCTLDHPLYDAVKGKVEASTLDVGDKVIMDNGEREITVAYQFRRACSKRKVVMSHGRLFWANGFLSHNSKQNPK